MKSGGETAGEGGRQGPCGRGWLDGGLAPVGKFLSVKCVEPLDRTSFLGPHSSFFSSTLTLFPCSFGEADSSCNLFSSFLLENLVSVSLRESSRERGNPFFSLSIKLESQKSLHSTSSSSSPPPPRCLSEGIFSCGFTARILLLHLADSHNLLLLVCDRLQHLLLLLRQFQPHQPCQGAC